MTCNSIACSPVDPTLAAAIARRVKDKKPLMLAMLAREFSVTEREAARALPRHMRAFARPDAFDALWQELTTWEKATFIMQHLGTVLEVKGTVPAGTHKGGYFNLTGETGIGGHLKVDDLEAIGFLSMPFMGLESLSVQFFNTAGQVKFSMYAGRDGTRRILPGAAASFERLKTTLCREEV